MLYLSLLQVRTHIPNVAWFDLPWVLTPAIRYSLIRRQFPSAEAPGQERQLLDYQIQQYKLFTALAVNYGTLFGTHWLNITIDLHKGDLGDPEVIGNL